MEKSTYIALSGGFDPIHAGHVRYIEAAKQFGPVLIILNTNDWLKRKKGYSFMSFEDRKEILTALGVDVVEADDNDDTVNASIIKHQDIIKAFGKGGDRTYGNIPELITCEAYGIPLILGLGGNKIQSSSELVRHAKSNT